MLDNVKLINNVYEISETFNNCMQRYGQKPSKMPPKWVFSPFVTSPEFFFKNQALPLLYPYGALTSCKKLKKKTTSGLLEDGLTDGLTDKGYYYGPRQVNPGSKNRKFNN